MSAQFVVYGIPVPQAGMRAVTTARGPRQISTGGKGLVSWRNDVAAAASAFAPIAGAVGVRIDFRFPMPASRPKKVRALGKVWHSVRPDSDKLVRAVFDSLTASGLIEDDARVAMLTVTKREVADGWTGASIVVSALADTLGGEQ